MAENNSRKRGLGKGLDALFDTPTPVAKIVEKNDSSKASETTINISSLEVNPYQPRKTFDKDALNDLANSIKENGVVQPLLVRKSGKKYQIIAGERRFRAAKLAGITKVPVIARELNDAAMMEIAIIENLQREDLNAIEEANGINSYMKELKLTQDQAAKKLGKSRSAIANLLRLLNLPSGVQQMIVEGKISMGHARALLSVESPKSMELLAKRIVSEGLSVRQVEQITSNTTNSVPTKTVKKTQVNNEYVREVIDQLEDKFATKVVLKKKKLEINFHNDDDLNRILDILGINLD